MATSREEFTCHRQLPITPTKKPARRKASRIAPFPTSPFNEDKEGKCDIDPWELFPEFQHPNSALRDDSESYKQQAQEQWEAQQQHDMFARRHRSPLNVEQKKDMMLQGNRYGPYEFMMPTPRLERRVLKRAQATQVVQSRLAAEQERQKLHERRYWRRAMFDFSPMKICTPVKSQKLDETSMDWQPE